MEIWFDTDCQIKSSDVQCECPLSPPPEVPVVVHTHDWETLFGGTFQHARLLSIQEVDTEHWLVCTPVGVGRLAVLDIQAFRLFQVFHIPQTLSEVIQAFPNVPVKIILLGLQYFLALGFLQDTTSPVNIVPQIDTTDTLTVWMHVTNACNLQCNYCYIQKNSEKMSEDTAFKAVDAIFRSAIKQHFRKVKIKYAGGEASLEIKRVSAIHDYAAQLASEFHLDFEAVLLSNGVVLSQRSIDLLKARAIEIMISLDGIGSFNDVQRPFRNGTGSFYYVKRTIARLQANDIYPNIAVTVSQRNLSGLVELIEYILDRKLPFTLNYYREHEHSSQLDGLSFTETHMIATMRTVFSVIVQRLPRQKLLGSLLDKTNAGIPHRHTCGVGRNYFVIDQHGGISKCHANIKHTVTSVHTNDPLLDIQKDASGIQNIPVEQKEGCQTCEWRYWCAGGCPLLTYKVTGRNDIRSPNCNIYKALFPEVLRMEALRLLQYQSSVVIE